MAKPMEEEDDEDDEEDGKKEEKDEFLCGKILKMTKYTSLPNLVRLGRWEQVSDEYIHTYQTFQTNQLWRVRDEQQRLILSSTKYRYRDHNKLIPWVESS